MNTQEAKLNSSVLNPFPTGERHKPSVGHTVHPLLTAAAVAELLALPKTTVYEAARQNRIGGVVRIGRVIRFDSAKLQAWLDAGGEALPGGWRHEEAS